MQRCPSLHSSNIDSQGRRGSWGRRDTHAFSVVDTQLSRTTVRLLETWYMLDACQVVRCLWNTFLQMGRDVVHVMHNNTSSDDDGADADKM